MPRSSAHFRLLALSLAAAVAVLTCGCAGLHMRVRPLGAEEGKLPPLRLFPLLHMEPERAFDAGLEERGFRHETGHAALAWPFVQHRWYHDAQGRRASFFGLHPIYSRLSTPNSEVGDGRSVFSDFIWPFFQKQWETNGEDTVRSKFLFVPLVLRQVLRRTPPDDDHELRKRLFVFPFWWQGSSRVESRAADGTLSEPKETSYLYFVPFLWLARGEPAYLPMWNPHGDRYTMVWPLYGYIPDYGPPGSRWSYRFFLWPLVIWCRSLDDDTKSLDLVWPFLRFQWGGDNPDSTSEVKFWPLFGWKQSGDHFRRYLLWPFLIWRDASEPDKPDRQFAFFPFVLMSDFKDAVYRIFLFNGYYKDDDERATFVLWPLFARWTHEGEQFKETQILWHIFRWRNGTGQKPNVLKQLVLFFRYKRTEDDMSAYHPILLWHRTRSENRFDGERGMSYTFTGQYSFPLFFSKKRTYEDGSTGNVARFVFPFCLYQREADGSSLVRGPWFFWQENFRGMNQNWTPLWLFFSSQRFALKPKAEEEAGIAEEIASSGDEAIRRTSIFGYLYRSEFGAGLTRRQFNLGPLAYDRIGDRRAVSVLGGWFPLVWGEGEE